MKLNFIITDERKGGKKRYIYYSHKAKNDYSVSISQIPKLYHCSWIVLNRLHRRQMHQCHFSIISLSIFCSCRAPYTADRRLSFSVLGSDWSPGCIHLCGKLKASDRQSDQTKDIMWPGSSWQPPFQMLWPSVRLHSWALSISCLTTLHPHRTEYRFYSWFFSTLFLKMTILFNARQLFRCFDLLTFVMCVLCLGSKFNVCVSSIVARVHLLISAPCGTSQTPPPPPTPPPANRSKSKPVSPIFCSLQLEKK